MERKSYLFHMTDYDLPDVREQISGALECVTELSSRRMCPTLWKVADWLNARPKASQEIIDKRRKRRLVVGLLNCLLGLFGLIPSFMAPNELFTVLLAGAACFGTGAGALWRDYRYVLSGVCIAGGAFLTFGGLLSPELSNMLLPGILLLVLAGIAIVSKKREKKLPHQKDAEMLLNARNSLPADAQFEVSFEEDGVKLCVRNTAEEEMLIPYSEVFCITETNDLLLLVIGKKGLILQKADLAEGSVEELREFLSPKVTWTETLTV